MRKVKQYIQYIDFFGKNTTLLFKNDLYYRTSLGVFCSIILIILSILGGTYFLSLFLQHSNPVIMSTQVSDDSPLYLGNQDFYIAFSIFNLTTSSNITICLKDQTNVIKTLKFDTFSNFCGPIADKNLPNLFCVNAGQELQNLDLDKDLEISVLSNSIEVDNSKSEIVLLYKDNIINSLDYENPQKPIIRKLKFKTISNFSKMLRISLEKVEIQSDDGSMFESFSLFSFFKVDNIYEEIINSDGELFKISIEKSSTKHMINRNYVKIYGVLANTGGLIKMLWLIIFCFIYPFVSLKYNKSLINEIFNFHEFEVNGNNENENKSGIGIGEALDKMKIFFNNMVKDKNKKMLFRKSIKNAVNEVKIDSPTKQIIKNTFKIKQNQLNLTFFETFFYYICNYKNLKSKKKLIERGSKAINKRLDISFILQKLVEVEKLKVLLLDSDQLKLFEYLPKPILTRNKDEKLFSKQVFLNKLIKINNSGSNYFQEKWSQLEEEDKTHNNILEKIFALLESYKIIKQRQNANIMDRKLFMMLDENIKLFLEQTSSSPKLKNFISKNNPTGNKNMNKLLSFISSMVSEGENQTFQKEKEMTNKIDEKKLIFFETINENPDISDMSNLGGVTNQKEETEKIEENFQASSKREKNLTKTLSKLNSDFKFLTKEGNNFELSSRKEDV